MTTKRGSKPKQDQAKSATRPKASKALKDLRVSDKGEGVKGGVYTGRNGDGG